MPTLWSDRKNMSDLLHKWVIPLLEFELVVMATLIAIAGPVVIGMAVLGLLKRNRRQ